jgi:hypothetical protein
MALQVHPNSTSSVKEALDNVAMLEDLLKLERSKCKSASDEKRQLEVQLKVREKELEKLTLQLEEIKAETGWSRGAVVTSRDFKGEENRIIELQIIVQRMEEEQRVDRQIQRKKTQLIETLSKELDCKKQLEEDFFKEQNDSKVKDREIKELKDELKSLKRVHTKKDKLITSMENENNDGTIKALEADKRFLQSEIAKHLEARRQQERALKAQQFRIDQLECRLEALAIALRDLRMGEIPDGTNVIKETDLSQDLTDINNILPEKEVIDVELYDLLQRDLEVAKNSRNVKEILIQEKDDCIEALEKKVDILEHAHRTESRTLVIERKENALQIEDLKRALDIQQETYQNQTDKLKQENARLKKKIRDLTQH